MDGEHSAQKELREKWPKMSYDEKVDTFLREMSWYHISKHIPGSPAKPIWDLAEVIDKATKSSESLTKSIRNATWVAAIVGGIGVLVAIISMIKSFL